MKMPEQKTFDMLPQDNSSSKWICWNKPADNILIIKKINDKELNRPFMKMIKYLISQKRKVFIEEQVYDDDENDGLKELKSSLQKFIINSSEIDLIITIGGDGTLLYSASLFQCKCPPIMAFSAGSLGFLTKFSLDNFESKIQQILNSEKSPIMNRSRLLCKIIKNDDGYSEEEEFHILNDVVVERNSHLFLSNVDLFINDNYITTVQGDGLIIATSTGSSAYSASAGASILHPDVQGCIITPICPHSLSFRPVVVPLGVTIKIKMAPESRNSGYIAIDGRHREELKIGYTLQITASDYPVPTLLAENDAVGEFFESLRTCLNWNDRKKQKPFIM